MISFKGAQFPRKVILFAVFFYVRYTVSYRDPEEIMAERGVRVDHATLNRWVAKYSPVIASTALRRKAPADRSWRMDETYIKVNGEWVYLYRAVDKLGKTLDFMLSKRRNKAEAAKFFARALEVNGMPRKIVLTAAEPTPLESARTTACCGVSDAQSRSRWSGSSTSTTLSSRITASSRSALDRCWASSPSSPRQQRSKALRWQT